MEAVRFISYTILMLFYFAAAQGVMGPIKTSCPNFGWKDELAFLVGWPTTVIQAIVYDSSITEYKGCKIVIP